MYGQIYRWDNPRPWHPFFGFILLAFFFAAILVAILYILTLRRALLRCAPQNRAAQPDSAWLLLIPFFHLFWQFVLYPRISLSIEREFRQRNLPIEPNPAYTLGLTLAILNACSLIPILNFFTGIAAFVCFILYWNRISHYANQLEAAPVTIPGAAPGAQPSWSPQPTATIWSAPTVTSAPAARYCTNCGSTLTSSERFCANCGTPVA
jgi:putative hemolysin